MAEGAPLLREYRVCSPIEGSNPSLSAIAPMLFIIDLGICYKSEASQFNDHLVIIYAPVAQLDRVLDYESRGQRFESSRARHPAMSPLLINPA